MSTKVVVALLLAALGTAACGGPSVVKRGVSTPPPGMDQLSPHDAEVQYPDRNRDRERNSS